MQLKGRKINRKNQSMYSTEMVSKMGSSLGGHYQHLKKTSGKVLAKRNATPVDKYIQLKLTQHNIP